MLKKNNDRSKTKVKRGASAYDTALVFLTPKARSVREVENRLDECDHSEIEIIETVERLTRAGLVNDEKYAHDFVESRLNTKPVSRRKLMEQLEGHFIPKSAIDEALETITDEIELANARKVGEKYFRQFASLELDERLRRVGLRLMSRAYGYDDIKTVLAELAESGDSFSDTADGGCFDEDDD
ncbi:MAG: RecX family transcriptional regulator [Clostridia bacterium]|nr:RecX family transcriptional regulator [Clostridia bacterium]